MSLFIGKIYDKFFGDGPNDWGLLETKAEIQAVITLMEQQPRNTAKRLAEKIARAFAGCDRSTRKAMMPRIPAMAEENIAGVYLGVLETMNRGPSGLTSEARHELLSSFLLKHKDRVCLVASSIVLYELKHTKAAFWKKAALIGFSVLIGGWIW